MARIDHRKLWLTSNRASGSVGSPAGRRKDDISGRRIYRARQSAGAASLALKKSSGVIIHGWTLRASPRSPLATMRNGEQVAMRDR
jgi:hypothetical protein